uniref:Uncharacterized protein n=1 Tax=Triticum urartu TaxID=4572 RepID=A0A8R7NZ36_TRIUA
MTRPRAWRLYGSLYFMGHGRETRKVERPSVRLGRRPAHGRAQWVGSRR